ncbi:unnamed protein product [Calicophoron daubneyi]|uniref:Uncharacterized protein n=1 Tax=Calicophoron daubneyi TaxID=300641 RepID=A0AAV2TG61_CALDB
MKIVCISTAQDLRCDLEGILKDALVSPEFYIIPSLKPSQLVEDKFIVGFCCRGSVSVYPLTTTLEFNFAVEDSVLTLMMSPIVYSGFGISCSKVKTGPKQCYYQFRTNLRNPNFRRNGHLHQQLRRFLGAYSGPLDSFRTPREAMCSRSCAVYWTPQSSDMSPFSGDSLPVPASLALFLSPQGYYSVRPTIKTVHHASPVRLPILRPDDSEDASSTVPAIDAASARLAFAILSRYATEGYDTDPESDSACSYLTDSCLSPMLSTAMLSMGSSYWSTSTLTVFHVSGLFTREQVSNLRESIRKSMEHSSDLRSVVLVGTRALHQKSPLFKLSVDGVSNVEDNLVGTMYVIDRGTATSTAACSSPAVVRFTSDFIPSHLVG